MLVPSYDAINTRSILVTAYGHAQFESPTWSKTLEEGERIVTPSRQLGGTLKKIHLDSGWLYPLRWSCRLPIQRGPDMLFFDLENHGFGSILLNFLLCVYVDEERLIWVGFFYYNVWRSGERKCRLRKFLQVMILLFLQSQKLSLLKREWKKEVKAASEK